MLGADGFDCDRLFGEARFALFSDAAVGAASKGSAEPLRDALGPSPSAEETELAAFAASVQGLAPFLGTLGDVETLPAELALFLRTEERRSAARSEKLHMTCLEVTSSLAAGGCDVVVLKGAALLLSALATEGLRPMGDIDLLLAEAERMDRASLLLEKLGWRALFDTRRHRVFGRHDERVARPGCEDPENPIRLELHYAVRTPVLGRHYDVTQALLAAAEPIESAGSRCLVAAGNALRRHLLVHAAEDFAAAGLRGVQAADFRLLAREGGPISIALAEADTRAGLAPLAYAADAVERLFPGSFAPPFLASLRGGVPKELLERAGRLPPLRHTRSPRGWSRTGLSLIEAPAPKARFFLRTAFPPLEEVKVNVAPEASGLKLAAEWLRLLLRRTGRIFGR